MAPALPDGLSSEFLLLAVPHAAATCRTDAIRSSELIDRKPGDMMGDSARIRGTEKGLRITA